MSEPQNGTYIQCPQCRGTGGDPKLTGKSCPSCGGSGVTHIVTLVKHQYQYAYTMDFYIDQKLARIIELLEKLVERAGG